MSISTFPYNQEVIERVISIRDFFVTLFFVALGMTMPLPDGMVIATALAATGFVLLSRLVTVMPVHYLLKQGNRVSLLSSLNLSQISEFSLVFAALGVSSGHIQGDTFAVIIVTIVFASALSTYLVNYSHNIYTFVNPAMKRVGLREIDGQGRGGARPGGRGGQGHCHAGFLPGDQLPAPEDAKHQLRPRQRGTGDRLQPGRVPGAEQTGREVYLRGHKPHGDPAGGGNREARVVLSTVPDGILKGTDNLRLIKQVRGLAPNASIVCTAESVPSALEMYRSGADYVFLPRIAAAEDLIEVLEQVQNQTLDQAREQQIRALMERDEVV